MGEPVELPEGFAHPGPTITTYRVDPATGARSEAATVSLRPDASTAPMPTMPAWPPCECPSPTCPCRQGRL